jgi:hypothetical protein
MGHFEYVHIPNYLLSNKSDNTLKAIYRTQDALILRKECIIRHSGVLQVPLFESSSKLVRKLWKHHHTTGLCKKNLPQTLHCYALEILGFSSSPWSQRERPTRLWEAVGWCRLLCPSSSLDISSPPCGALYAASVP